MIKYNLQVTYITKAKANNGTELEMCNNNLLTLDMYQAHWAITQPKIVKKNLRYLGMLLLFMLRRARWVNFERTRSRN